MRIGRKLTLGFTLVIIAIIIADALCLRIFWRIDQERRDIKDAVMPTVGQTLRLYESLVDMDHWIATYLLTNDVHAYERAAATFEQIQTLCDNPPERFGWPDERLALTMTERIEDYLTVVRSIAQMKQQGYDTRDIVETTGLTYHAKMNDMLRELGLHRQRTLAEINNVQLVLETQESMGWWIISLAVISVFFIVLGTGFLVTRSITHPISHMQVGIEALAQGNLHARINLTRKDELGQLAQAFDRMADYLQKSTVSIEQLNQEITERKRTEKDLDIARRQADSANEAKSQFLANVSHEIRTPLNAIITMSRMLSERNQENLTAKQREGLDIVHWSSQQLLSLINSVLDLSKIEAGHLELTPSRVELSPLLAGLKRMGQTLIGDKAIALQIPNVESLPQTIMTDAQALQIILTNIIANAIKFTEQGTVQLEIDHTDTHWSFSVTDTGIGIAPEQLERIFNEFTQADETTTRRYQGTGLGLSIAKRLVEQLGGDITIKSTLGKGTSITVYLPHSQEPAAIAPPPIANTETRTKDSDITKTRVLIAEDDKFGRAALRLMLEDHCDLILAEDGKDAVEKANNQNPNIIFLDIMMPDMDGYEAFTEIRKTNTKVPIIALTAKALSSDREAMLDFGFTDYLSKPIDEEKLIDMVAKYTPIDH